MSTRVAIYARVSTSSQDYERQINELREYADRMKFDIVKEFSEKVSGTKKAGERIAIMQLLKLVEANLIDKVLVYECSRLSRNAVDFLNIVQTLTDHHVSIYILQNGLETLLPNGQINPIAQLVLGILAQFNSMERTLIRNRMESGYKHFRENGGKVGRKVGYRKSNEQMKEQYAKEIQLLRKGISLRNVSAITHTSINTLRKIRLL